MADQLAFLIEACARFDAGSARHSKQIAVALRVLLHDAGRNSHSVLAQIRKLYETRWLDSAGPINERNLITTMNLTMMSVSAQGTVYTPSFDTYQDRAGAEMQQSGRSFPLGRGRMLPFDEWWSMTVIRDSERNDFSRKGLVLTVANQDGGAHVDPSVDAQYHQLSRQNSLGWSHHNDHGDTPLGNPVDASLRQIAHEVLRSLPRRLHSDTVYSVDDDPFLP